MKLFLLVVCVLLVTSTMAKKHRHKHEKKQLPKHEEPKEERDEIDMIAEDNESEGAADKGHNKVEEKRIDPCSKKHCGAGRECALNDKSEATCKCVKKCPPERDERRKVCSNHNETWNSDCEVYQARCWCEESEEKCKHEKYKHVHVDYYGACREIGECTSDEMADFPRRMREWLFNIMQDLAQREMASDSLKQLVHEAEDSLSRKWVNAIIWKFCDLDTHPHDRGVSRHELFPLRAPLLSMEHCIAPFLDKCDANDDHLITLQEWGTALGLEEGEIQNKCDMLH